MTTTDGKMAVIADDRERNSGVPEVLACMEAFDVRIERLSAGDYQVDSRFLFERKTLPDFAASLISGRLFDQALRLASPHIARGRAKWRLKSVLNHKVWSQPGRKH